MNQRRRWVGRILIRLLTAAGTLLFVAIAVFLALNLLKGGFANVYLGPSATPEQIAGLNAQYGLDRPILEQLLTWLGGATHGDFGHSLVSGQPVSAILALRLPVTIELAVYAMVLAVAIGVPVGVLVGVQAKSRASFGLRVVSGLSISIPDFVVASLIVFILARMAPTLLQLGTFTPIATDPLANLGQLFFPALTLALYPAAIIVRTLRDSIRSVLTEPFVNAALLRGENGRQVTMRHVIRNAILPAITVVTVGFGALFGGAVIVETIFGLPGMGQQIVSAINQRDYAVVQAGVVIGAAGFIAVNLLSDWINSVVDPRIRA